MEKFVTSFKDKKILLVALNSPFLDDQYVFPHLGILYLIAIAAKIGMKVKFIDAKDMLTSEMLLEYDIFYTDEFDDESIEQYRGIDIVGISCTTSQSKQLHQVCLALKTRYPQIITLLGGPHATYYLDECRKENVDIIVTGDGERIFEELLLGEVDKLSSRLLPESSSKQTVFHDNLTEKEMNSYPIPYREKEYIGKYNYNLDGVKATTLVNSRGCPMGCAFCEHGRIKPKWFLPKHFEEEVQNIVDQGIKGVMIFDDIFAIKPTRIVPYLKILKHFHKENSLVFRCFGHAKVMTSELATLLYESGCAEVGFGAESASQEILDTVCKRTTVEQMHTFVKIVIQAGIRVKAFFMIGLPGETEQTFKETYDFIKKYRTKYPKSFDFDLTVFFPYKGTLIGDSIRLDETLFNIRSRISWSEIDAGDFGAYKKKKGTSDVVIETYDWENNKVFLSAEKISELQKKIMFLSGKYTNGCDSKDIG